MKNFLTFLSNPSDINSISKKILACNESTRSYGLLLTPSESLTLAKFQQTALQNSGRIDLSGATIPEKIISVFCDSPYLTPTNYFDTLTDLLDIFYYYKTELLEQLSDDELIEFMKKHFDNSCQGSLELLSGRALYRLARQIHYGDEFEDDSF